MREVKVALILRRLATQAVSKERADHFEEQGYFFTARILLISP